MEKRVREVLQVLYPGRTEWSGEEESAARRVLAWRGGSGDTRPSRSEVLPTKFVPVGGRVRLGGEEFECVKAPAETCPSAACEGCAFSRKGRGCWNLQCSPQDRRDGRFVWFREVGDE